jgi:hypothetical protein
VKTSESVTLCCVDTAYHDLSVMALRRCDAQASFAKTIFLTDRAACVDPGWEFHRIARLGGYADFNRFMLKNLYYHIETDFVLIVQFDGFILNGDAWTDEFLSYDYVGSPWSWCTDLAVGNGGFCLRSRKLLRALQDERITVAGATEDLCICRTYRSYLEVEHGIRFAPVELASRFGFEGETPVPGTFGFHGLVHLADFYTGDTACFLLDRLEEFALRRVQAIQLVLRYVVRERHEEAAMAFNRLARYQSRAGGRDLLRRCNAGDGLVTLFEESWGRYVA